MNNTNTFTSDLHMLPAADRLSYKNKLGYGSMTRTHSRVKDTMKWPKLQCSVLQISVNWCRASGVTAAATNRKISEGLCGEAFVE